MARKKGGNNKNNNNNFQNNNRNNLFRNNNQTNHNNHSHHNNNGAIGKYCTHCKRAGHTNAECFFKAGGNNSHNTGINALFNAGNKWTKDDTKKVEDDPKFKFCKMCSQYGHDITTCNVLAKELKAHGAQTELDGVTGLFVPNNFQNGSKINKEHVNPFLREKELPNPFAELTCTHSSQCRGLCGNEHYMSKTRQLKKQLEEALVGMQLWLETITPPEEDPFSMDWEAAPAVVIPQPNPNAPSHVDPLRLWNPYSQPVRMNPQSAFLVHRPPLQVPKVGSIDKYLRTNYPQDMTRTIPQFQTPDLMALDPSDADERAKLAARAAEREQARLKRDAERIANGRLNWHRDPNNAADVALRAEQQRIAEEAAYRRAAENAAAAADAGPDPEDDEAIAVS